MMSFEQEKSLQKLVYPDAIVYSKEKGVVQTARVKSLFDEIAPLASIVNKNKNGDSSMNRQNSSQVPGTNLSTNMFFEDLRNILKYQIKETR